MRGVIKGVLAEELQNSIRLKKGYELAIKKLPRGCLSLKKIKGHKYYYLVERRRGELKYSYKGSLSSNEVQKYREAKISRARNRKLLSKVKSQIKFLRSSLRGKEAV
ncbi:MAG: hypothetical protein PHR73_06130 [Candidatus Omnitrophica bacterium]|nr:hypothetical protein [Candidatus Omnitrophota bacterium]